MKFAITHPLITHPYHPDLVSAMGVTTTAQAVERAGFHGYGFTDHPSPTDRWLKAGGHDALDPFVALGFAAAVTSTLRLLPSIVVLPYRNPFVVAKAVATLDVLSGGRFTLAVGTGYLKGEFEALGVDHTERNELMDEALGVLNAVWTGDSITVEGRHFSARGITVHPKPVTQPHPPIWIAGNSGRARQRVADHAQGWYPFRAPADVAAAVRTTALETFDGLQAAIGDLRHRLDVAGRDSSSVDIMFANIAGGAPASDDFNPDAHLESLDRLAAMGVTWVQVELPGDSLQHALEAAGRYGEEVIAKCSGLYEGAHR